MLVFLFPKSIDMGLFDRLWLVLSFGSSLPPGCVFIIIIFENKDEMLRQTLKQVTKTPRGGGQTAWEKAASCIDLF